MRGGERQFKSLLFQAKKGDLQLNADLKSQVRKMEKLAQGGSALFEYREDGYRAVPGSVFSDEEPNRISVKRNQHPLGSFLGDEFLPCNTGLRGMYYDAVREQLLVPNAKNGVSAIPVELHHRVLIGVERLR